MEPMMIQGLAPTFGQPLPARTLRLVRSRHPHLRRGSKCSKALVRHWLGQPGTSADYDAAFARCADRALAALQSQAV